MKERNESLFEKNVQYLTSGWKLQDQVEEMEEKVNALEQEQDDFKNTISELCSSNQNLGRLLLSLKDPFNSISCIKYDPDHLSSNLFDLEFCCAALYLNTSSPILNSFFLLLLLS
ncbi:unnamed protein product [Rhizophagus irregularis]|nr:unnamed protein product [Rhizophagus irregularis]